MPSTVFFCPVCGYKSGSLCEKRFCPGCGTNLNRYSQLERRTEYYPGDYCRNCGQPTMSGAEQSRSSSFYKRNLKGNLLHITVFERYKTCRNCGYEKIVSRQRYVAGDNKP